MKLVSSAFLGIILGFLAHHLLDDVKANPTTNNEFKIIRTKLFVIKDVNLLLLKMTRQWRLNEISTITFFLLTTLYWLYAFK
jgi:hypothetical protein